MSARDYLLAGGIDSQMSKVSNKAYLYNHEKKICKIIKEKMNRGRYGCMSIWKAPFMYVIGGRSQTGNAESTCERFELQS